MAKKWSFHAWVVLSFFVVFIFLNIFDYFNALPSDFDYLKKLLSWALLGYLLFQASFSKVFFGSPNRFIDLSLIIAYFLLIINKMVGYAWVAYHQASVIKIPFLNWSYSSLPFYAFIIDYSSFIETAGFFVGLSIIVSVAFHCALRTLFHKRSVMGVLHETGEPGWKHFLSRFIVTIIVLLAFFLFVFNMVMEWLAIAIDATLLLVALLFYLFFFLRGKISSTSLLYKVGETGNNFYTTFLDHFRYKNTFLLGLSGLLVLHLITDIGIYLIPYITGFRNPLYFSRLDSVGREGVFDVFLSDFALSADPLLVLVFLANIIGFLLLFVSPSIMWYQLYHRKAVRLHKTLLFFFFFCLPSVIFAPLFLIKRLQAKNFVGVDVQTQSMLMGLSPFLVFCITILAAVLLFILMRKRLFISKLQQLWVSVSLVFFGVYAYYYFIDVASYYQALVIALLKGGSYVLGITFLIFQALIIIFYVCGYFLFLYELGKHVRSKKKNL